MFFFIQVWGLEVCCTFQMYVYKTTPYYYKINDVFLHRMSVQQRVFKCKAIIKIKPAASVTTAMTS